MLQTLDPGHPSLPILIEVMQPTLIAAHNASMLTHHSAAHQIDHRLAATRALASAMLRRALDDLRLEGWLRDKAIAWFGEQRDETDPGSLEWCCAVLDIDPDVVRRRCGRGFQLRPR